MPNYFPISDKPIPGNRVPEEHDVKDIPVNENVLTATPESEHDHIRASSTSSQATNSKTNIIDDVSDDSIVIPDKRTNEIVDEIDFHNATLVLNTFCANVGGTIMFSLSNFHPSYLLLWLSWVVFC